MRKLCFYLYLRSIKVYMRMKNLITKVAMLVVLLMLSGSVYAADNSTKVEGAMRDLLKKYDKTEGVMSVTVTRGKGLELVKMMLNKQLGKSFMKGVKSITILTYSEASAEVCQAVRKDLDVFTSLLEEFDMKDKDSKEASKSEYSRCFACTSAAHEGKLSDFVIAIEDEEIKTVIHMAGVIEVKDLVEK